MSLYQTELFKYLKAHPGLAAGAPTAFIRPPSRFNEVFSFLEKQQLEDLSISRPKSRLSWGIELPFDRDYVTYVWFDALVNYISALEYLVKDGDGSRFWPATIHLVGKDILTTHAVYWSTILMALKLPLPQTIFAHGWWTVNGEKMSKSRGNVVDPHAIIEEFGVDAFRYFLLREVPFGQDGDFSRRAMIGRINSELADGLGNLLSRTLTMIERFTQGRVPSPTGAPKCDLDTQLTTSIGKLGNAKVDVEELRFNRALETLWELIQCCDQYIDKAAPWKLAKKPEEKNRLDAVLYHVVEALGWMIPFLYPFMPQTAIEIARQLGLNPRLKGRKLEKDGLVPGTEILKGAALFPRIDTSTVTIQQGERRVNTDQPVAQPHPASQPAAPAGTAPAMAAAPAPTAPAQITIEDFQKVQLKVAKVLTAERVPKSEKLIKLQVDLGNEQRQIVAGIGKKYEPEQLVGKRIVIVANLKPAKLMGVESQGMVLAAGDKEVGGLATIVEDVEPGTKVK
jgi:methionyl-tRNA synthetase